MKVIELLRHLHYLEEIRFFFEDEEEPVFQGSVLDLPWIYADLELNDSENGEAICSTVIDGKSYIEIYGKEAE